MKADVWGSLLAALAMACSPGAETTESAKQPAPVLFSIGDHLEGRSEEIFTDVMDARLTPNGHHIVILDASPPYVRIFDREGVLERALVPEGDGPAEARSPHSIAVTDSSFALAEPGRISVHRLEGGLEADFRALPFIPQNLTRGCGADWIIYGPGPDGDQTIWLRAVSAVGDSAALRTIMEDDVAGSGVISRLARPVARGPSRILVYHDAPSTPEILSFACPDYRPAGRHLATSATRSGRDAKERGSMTVIQPEERQLSATVFIDSLAYIVRSMLHDGGRWQELINVKDEVLASGPGAYRILDVERGLALLAVDEPIPHVVLTDAGAVVKFAPLAEGHPSSSETVSHQP